MITGLNGVDFEEAYQNLVRMSIEGTDVNFVDLETLKKSKVIAGRPKDLEDIRNLT